MSTCSACLSADRKLYILLGEFKKIYRLICKNIVQNIMHEEIQLCWECIALIKNVKKFQEKVLNSQNILTSCIKNDKKILTSNFSNFSISITVLDSFFGEDLKTELSSDLEVKEEINEVPNNFDSCEYNETFDEFKAYSPPEMYLKDTDKEDSIKAESSSIDELKNEYLFKNIKENQDESSLDGELEGAKRNKKETVPTSVINDSKISSEKTLKRLKLKKDRKSLYRIVTISRSKVNTYKRVSILPHEVRYWMEKERNSAYYKKLKRKCDQCASKIDKSHSKYHIKGLKYNCEFCGFSHHLKGSLIKHLRNHLFVRCCNVCGYKCIQKLHMYSHARTHRAVECLTCRATFNSTWAFYDHYRKMHYELNDVYYCDHCQKKCLQKRTIEKHIVRKHLPQICRPCNLTFNNTAALQKHRTQRHRIERTEAAYCVQCDRQFDNVPLFKAHLSHSAVHAAERKPSKNKESAPYQCPACPNVYKKVTSMRNHYNKVHSEKARFCCTQCDKIFLTNAKLRNHNMYSHQGLVREKNKICNVCGRGFTEKTVLVKHMRTHTGERPYECPQCDAKFAQRTAMLTHCKNIHMKREGKLAPAT